MNHVETNNSARGFSLVELMIAIMLGLILIAGVIQVFLGNRQTQLSEQSVARVQESGRMALNFIQQDLRVAGFYGAGNFSNQLTSIAFSNLATGSAYAQYTNFSSNAIRTYTKSTSGAWSPSAPSSNDMSATAISNARNGSDLVAIFYGYDTGAAITSTVSGTTNVPIKFSNATSSCFNSGDLAMLSSLTNAVIFKVTNSPACTALTQSLQHSTTGNSNSSLGGTYDQYSRVMKLQHRVYYVGNTGRTNSKNEPVWALYRSDNGGAPEELVEGIEFLKFQFGERLSSGNVRYGDASVVTQSGVTSARIGVLAQGLDPIRTVADTDSYDVTGTGATVNPSTMGDGTKTLRRVFVSNVELRNRTQ